MKNFKLLFSSLLLLVLFASCESENLQVDEVNIESETIETTYSFFDYLQTIGDSYTSDGVEVVVFIDDRGIVRIRTGASEVDKDFGDDILEGFDRQLNESATEVTILCTFIDGREDVLNTCDAKDNTCVETTVFNFLTDNGTHAGCPAILRYYKDCQFVNLVALG